MNATMGKFGYPETLIHEYHHWVVQLRPEQATLGALVLCCKDPASQFSDISTGAFAELPVAVTSIEGALRGVFNYEKINYLMLMMVDPDVHFHVLPRYSEPQTFSGTSFEDPGWPGPPQLGTSTTTDPATFTAIADALKNAWPG